MKPHLIETLCSEYVTPDARRWVARWEYYQISLLAKYGRKWLSLKKGKRKRHNKNLLKKALL